MAKTAPKTTDAGHKVVVTNRQARFEYHIDETLEAGIALVGTEVKSIRAGRANLQESYVDVTADGLVLRGMHVSPYELGGYVNHEPTRPRRLLVHREQIRKLEKAVEQKGYTLVPLRLYFAGGKLKVEVAVARGKQLHDKRDAIADRESKRTLDRARKGMREE